MRRLKKLGRHKQLARLNNDKGKKSRHPKTRVTALPLVLSLPKEKIAQHRHQRQPQPQHQHQMPSHKSLSQNQWLL